MPFVYLKAVIIYSGRNCLQKFTVNGFSAFLFIWVMYKFIRRAINTDHEKIEFIYWFAYYNLDSPSVRYRAKYALDFFKAKKEIGNYLILPGYKPKCIFLFLKAYFSALLFRKRNSLIVIQRVQSHFIYANLLKLLVRVRYNNSIYDLDDADYLQVNPDTIYYFARHCHKISAGSRQIEIHLRQFNAAVFHTTSPIVDLGIVKENRNSIFTVGWIGGFGGDHKDSLIELVFPALKELTCQLKFVIIGVLKTTDIEFIHEYFSLSPNVQLEIPTGIDWNDEVYIQKCIVSFDVGIASLAKSEMHISKSGIKAKQYLNNGVPVLSTDLPENNTVVVDGLNGFFCSTIHDFKEGIIKFSTMTDTNYSKFSINARKSIINFDHNKYFEDFVKIISDILPEPD
ncbi:MAG TPA: hypothetical protein PLP88_06465 [Bacteroidales bacterium]|nr:hypothetical protein [Bacteroidales bacterium]